MELGTMQNESKMTLIKKTDGSRASEVHYTYDLVTQEVISVEIHYASELGLGHELAHAIRHKAGLYDPEALSLQSFKAVYKEEHNTWLLCKTFIKPKYWDRKEAQRQLDSYFGNRRNVERLLIF